MWLNISLLGLVAVPNSWSLQIDIMNKIFSILFFFIKKMSFLLHLVNRNIIKIMTYLLFAYDINFCVELYSTCTVFYFSLYTLLLSSMGYYSTTKIDGVVDCDSFNYILWIRHSTLCTGSSHLHTNIVLYDNSASLHSICAFCFQNKFIIWTQQC